MHAACTTRGMLSVWEAGGAAAAHARAVALQSAAWPEAPEGGWAERPIGERDGLLLQLREAWFGPHVEATAVCPACGERVEAGFETSGLGPRSRHEGALEVSIGGRAVPFRIATTSDVLAATGGGAAGARERLLERCVPGWRGLDQPSLDAVVAAMSGADPLADIRIELTCPACGQCWALAFDIGAHLWGDLDDWARQLLRDVHTLAWAYGWGEREILD